MYSVHSHDAVDLSCAVMTFSCFLWAHLNFGGRWGFRSSVLKNRFNPLCNPETTFPADGFEIKGDLKFVEYYWVPVQDNYLEHDLRQWLSTYASTIEKVLVTMVHSPSGLSLKMVKYLTSSSAELCKKTFVFWTWLPEHVSRSALLLIESWNHRTVEWVGSEGTLKTI